MDSVASGAGMSMSKVLGTLLSAQLLRRRARPCPFPSYYATRPTSVIRQAAVGDRRRSLTHRVTIVQHAVAATVAGQHETGVP